MKLSQMQDLGGCRAVLRNVELVKGLVSKYIEFHAKSPKNRSDWDGSDNFDYILRPKPDGCVHLVFRFKSSSPKWCMYNGQRIEIQIRSRLQHVWATVLETAQLFTGQVLKSKVKDADLDWLRFFALTSSAFALREKTETVPGTPASKSEIVSELREIMSRTKIMSSLSDWNDSVRRLQQGKFPKAFFYLLTLDSQERTLRIDGFEKDQAELSQRAYDEAERATSTKPNVQVVLVSVDDVDALRKAYPNYYMDTKGFIDAVNKENADT